MREKWGEKRHLKYEHFHWNTFTGYIIWESSHLCVITLTSPQPWYEMLHFNHICIQLPCWLEHLVLKQFFSFGWFFCFNIRMLFSGNMSFLQCWNIASLWTPAHEGTFISSWTEQQNSMFQSITVPSTQRENRGGLDVSRSAISISCTSGLGSLFSFPILLIFPWLFRRNICTLNIDCASCCVYFLRISSFIYFQDSSWCCSMKLQIFSCIRQ